LTLDRKTWWAVVNMVVSFWVLKCACEHGGGCEPLDAIKGRKLVDQKCYLLKKDSGLWNYLIKMWNFAVQFDVFICLQ
jgi:hypothetical protein